MPATVEQSNQQLLKNCDSDCWAIVPVTIEQPCKWLLKNRTSNCWTIVPVAIEQSFQWLLNNRASESCQFLVKGISEQTLWSVCEYLWVKRAFIIKKPFNGFAIQIVWVFAERHFCKDYDWRHLLAWLFLSVTIYYTVTR